MKKVSKPVAKSYRNTPRYALVDLTDQEIGYIILALKYEDANPEVTTALMAKLGCYLAAQACLHN
jgi:hypothetical protein